MYLINKCELLKFFSWLFFSSVILQGLYSGFKFGCWWGLFTAALGTIIGFLYGKIKRNKC